VDIKKIKEVMSYLGKKGVGKSKVRGDSEYYRKIVKKRWDSAKKKGNV